MQAPIRCTRPRYLFASASSGDSKHARELLHPALPPCRAVTSPQGLLLSNRKEWLYSSSLTASEMVISSSYPMERFSIFAIDIRMTILRVVDPPSSVLVYRPQIQSYSTRRNSKRARNKVILACMIPKNFGPQERDAVESIFDEMNLFEAI